MRALCLLYVLFCADNILFGQTASSPSKGSKAARDASNVSIIAKPIGIYEYIGGGFQVGLHIDGDNTVEVSHFAATSCLDGTCRYNLFYYDISLRHYFLSAFNIRTGLTTRRKRINYHHRHAKGENYSVLVTQNTIGPNVSIGHLWQFHKFTIGADWVGLYVPITTLGPATISGEDDGEITSDQRQDVLHDAEKVNKWPALMVVQFMIGVAF